MDLETWLVQFYEELMRLRLHVGDQLAGTLALLIKSPQAHPRVTQTIAEQADSAADDNPEAATRT